MPSRRRSLLLHAATVVGAALVIGLLVPPASATVPVEMRAGTALTAASARGASVPATASASPPASRSASTSSAPSPAASSSALEQRVAALNERIGVVGEQLAAEAVAYERAQQRLAELTQDQSRAGVDADALASQSTESRAAIDELARAAYKGGMPPVVSALLTGDPRSIGQLAYVQRSVNTVGVDRLARTDALVAGSHRAEQTVTLTDTERREALVLRQQLDRQLASLSAEADRLSTELGQAAAALEAARAREQSEALAKAAAADRVRMLTAQREAEQRKAAVATAVGLPYVPGVNTGGGGCQMLPPGLEVNGFLSGAGLCPISVGGGHRLRTDAAKAFDRMNAAHIASVGTPLCVTDSYRSYAEQVSVFKRKPGLAATPGKSNHGWGLAVDFCGGVQTFGSFEHAWMQQNARLFGWVHPAWAEPGGRRPEAWHWEFAGGPSAVDRGPSR